MARLPRPRAGVRSLAALIALLLATPLVAEDESFDPPPRRSLDETCLLISERLASVRLPDCRDGGLRYSGAWSNLGTPILYKEYPPLPGREPQGRVLLFGGIHGDEYSSISIVFHWMRILNEHHSGRFHWLVVPLLNPDGLLRSRPTRTNERGIDLNRNFPSAQWREEGYRRWVERTGKRPRYFPGHEPLSEPETRWLTAIIRGFQPDAIISVHAPLGLVDYDGPGEPPASLGSLRLRRLGNFPGTLGHFAGVDYGIPVVTIELESAGRMPAPGEVTAIWTDMVRWLGTSVPFERSEERMTDMAGDGISDPATPRDPRR